MYASSFAAAQNPRIRAHMVLKAQTAEEALADFRWTQLPGADSFGRTIYLDGRYIGDIWCYCMNLADNPQAIACLIPPSGIAALRPGAWASSCACLTGASASGAWARLPFLPMLPLCAFWKRTVLLLLSSPSPAQAISSSEQTAKKRALHKERPAFQPVRAGCQMFR